MTPSNFWRLGLVTACGLLPVVNACSGSSFSASPSESGGSDAGEAASAGQGGAGGAPDHGGSSAGGAPAQAGSVSESGAGGVAEPSEAGSGGLGGADLGAAGSSDNAGSAGSSGSAGDCTAVAWFPDADGDGFGRASGQVFSCDPPAVGKWASKAGDCNDDNNAVFPKESTFEANGYTASSNGISFDYDCSNQEESDPSQLGAAPACGGLTILNCAGSGFASTARTGTGVNPLCGSKSLVTCMTKDLGCVAVTTVVADGVRCR